LLDVNENSDSYKEKFEIFFKELPIPTYTWQIVKDDMILFNTNNADRK